MEKYIFRAAFARRIPDPTFFDESRAERHVLFPRACDLPANLKRDPNVREQNPDKKVYKQVGKSLRNEYGAPDTFHLKNKGITIIAHRVEKVGNEYHVYLKDGQGIVDGGHTYTIIQQAISDGVCPETQYVKVEILTGIPDALLADVADGLNTSVQVQLKSLANHRGQFDWIRDTMQTKGLAKYVAFRENEDAEYDIREIIAFLTLFNIGQQYYPNATSVVEHPIVAFSGKEKTLERYVNDEQGNKSYRKLQPIVLDILELMETISADAGKHHNTQNKGRAGKLSFMEYREKKPYHFPFTNRDSEHRLQDGALYPVLAAFRYLVVEDKGTGEFHWKCKNGFAGVLAIWEQAAGELMRALKDQSEDLSRNVNAMGKNRGLWNNLYNIVKARALEAGIQG